MPQESCVNISEFKRLWKLDILTYACKHHCLLPAGAAAHCSLVTFWWCYCCQLRPISYSTTTPSFGMAPHSQRASALALDEAVPNEGQTKCFAAGAAWSQTHFCVSTREQKILALLSAAPTGKRWVQPSSLSQRTSFLSQPMEGEQVAAAGKVGMRWWSRATDMWSCMEGSVSRWILTLGSRRILTLIERGWH